MSLQSLPSRTDSWEEEKGLKNACLQQGVTGGELVFIVVHIIDMEPTCAKILQEQLIIKGPQFFTHRIS